MTYDNSAAKKGQAINLAVADALHNKEENNPAYIYKKFLYYFSIADAIQSSNADMILEVINNHDFSSLIGKLKETLK